MIPEPYEAPRQMRPRDLGTLLFGFAGLYTLLLALLGAAQLLRQLPASTAMLGGRLQIQAAFVNAAVSVLLHMVLGAALLGGRCRLALWLLGEAGEPGRPASAGAAGAAGATTRNAGAAGAARRSAGPAPRSDALGTAAAGVCFVAILLVSRVATALTYAISLLLLPRGERSAFGGWTIGGILLDLLLAAAGLLLVARRDRVAARLLALPPDEAAAAAAGGEAPAWQLPGLRFVGLTLVVWYLPDAASALSVFVRGLWQPPGFDPRSQASDRLAAAGTGILAGLYLLLLFPAGLSALWHRLREPPPAPPSPHASE